jgi:hypothetical protein
MSKNNSDNNYLLIRDLIDESIIRDSIVFLLIFLFILSQSWQNLFLLLFPVITFCFSLFFKIISNNKWRLKIEEISIEYNPFGSEKRNANRLNICTLIQLTLLFWIGSESLYHPQLIENYSIYFIILLCFIYSFGYIWIFIDIWKYSKIRIESDSKISKKTTGDQYIENNDEDGVISLLKFDLFKLISIVDFIFFISLNGLNILLVLFNSYNFVPQFIYYLPGTGIEGSEPIILPITLVIIFISSPILATVFLIKIYNEINNFNKYKFKELLNLAPISTQKQIIEHLKNINKKFQKELEIE